MEVSNFPLVAPPLRSGEVEQEVQDQGNLQATARRGGTVGRRRACRVKGAPGAGWEANLPKILAVGQGMVAGLSLAVRACNAHVKACVRSRLLTRRIHSAEACKPKEPSGSLLEVSGQ